MNTRIIAGKFGSRPIDAPGRRSTHVMSERARAALFNSLGGYVEGARVLDTFAGSGSLGLEALSRGAESVVFVERDRIAAKIIANNVKMLGVGDKAAIVQAGISSWIDTSADEKFDLIFADPPYMNPQFSTVSKIFGLLKPRALMVLSHPGNGEVPIQDGIVVVDNRSYGNLYLTVFRRDDV